MTRLISLFLLGMAVSVSNRCFADANISFRGSLVEGVPCVVNGGENIIVNFGDEVMTTRIEDGSVGGIYSKSFVLSNDCPAGESVRYQIKATAASADNKVLIGDRTGLGFTFWSGEYLTVNTWLPTRGGESYIYVTPTRLNGAVISGGTFNTHATILVEYQ